MMPSYALSNFTAPDRYLAQGVAALNGAGVSTGPATLYPLPILDHVLIDVANAAIYWSIAETNRLGSTLAGAWQPEVFMLPGSRVIDRDNIVGIRVRAAVLAVNLPATGPGQAQVTVEAVEL